MIYSQKLDSLIKSWTLIKLSNLGGTASLSKFASVCLATFNQFRPVIITVQRVK